MSDSPNSYSWTLKGRNKSKRNVGRSQKSALDDNTLMAQLQTNLPMPDLFTAAAYQRLLQPKYFLLVNCN